MTEGRPRDAALGLPIEQSNTMYQVCNRNNPRYCGQGSTAGAVDGSGMSSQMKKKKQGL